MILGGVAHAQEWRGMGRVGGKVVDEATGQAIEGVTVKAVMPRSENRGPGDAKSNGRKATFSPLCGDILFL